MDLDKGELTVRHTLSRVDGELVLTEPRTDRPRRRVPLHAGVVVQLRAHRTRQLQERLAAGLLSGSRPLITRPPFVAPHPTASVAALVGGGTGLARPGAVRPGASGSALSRRVR